MNKKYYALEQKENEANLFIFGEITSWKWLDNDVSAIDIANELNSLDVDTINVYINSYGGEVAEGLAIYNTLKAHKAKIKTYCSGFACSIASIIFMAGDERIMYNSSMLMIHNPWSRAVGNSKELRKTADDLDKTTQALINAYMSCINITEEELKELLDNESYILPSEALDKGFATAIEGDETNDEQYQSARRFIFNSIKKNNKLIEKVKEVENKVQENGQEKIIKEEEEVDYLSTFLNAIK